MPHITRTGHAMVAVGFATAMLLAGCGGSSPSPSASKSASSKPPTATNTTTNATATTTPGAKKAGVEGGTDGTHATSSATTTSTSSSISTPRLRAALDQAVKVYASCLGAHGISPPKANTTGHGPIINTKGLDTNSPLYKRVSVTCRAAAVNALHAGERASTPSR